MLRLNIKVFKCGLYLCTRYMYMHLWLIPRLYPIYPLPYTPHLTIWRYWWSKMFDFHLPEAQQFPNSNAAIGFKSNPITTSYRKYAKQSMFDSMVTVVFAKNYPKHAKLMVCVWNPRRCWPPLLRHFEASMAIFFSRSKWASKIEEKCVPLDSQRILGCMRVFPYMRMLHY